MTNLKWIFISIFTISAFFKVNAENTDRSMKDSIDENFVIASVLLAEPGGALYSNVGHVALRLQCPEHQLDYIFSYESEDVSQKILSFLAGKLKMGLFAINTADYLNSFKQEERGVKEYILNMPIEVKRNLWRVCDNHMMEGVNLPYDYINRGCAYSTLRFLREGLDTIPIQFGPWPEKFQKLNRRELTALCMKDHPWSWCFMNLISNGSINDDCPMTEKIIMPEDLITVLSKAKVQDNPLLSSPIQLLPSGSVKRKTWFTPTLLSVIILLLTIVTSLYKKNTMDYVLLIIQSIIGFIAVYLMFFSDLVCTESNCLLVPFNPLPLLFWRWRHKWSLPYAIIIATWIVAVLLWTHSLTDTPYILLSLALIVSYVKIYYENKK
jgi:hypothetical protein